MKKLWMILLALCMVSCVSEDEFENTPEGNLDALWTAIDEHYCFLDYKKATLGVDWNEIHWRYRSKLSPTMGNMQLFEVMAAMLSELKDGHVNLYTSADVARNWSWKEDYPKNLDTELRAAYLGNDYRIAGGLKYRILPDNIGYIVYESFSSGIGDGNLTDVMYYLAACRGIIIDVRGNGGGQLDYAELLSRYFTNEKLLVGYMAHKTGTGHSDFSSPDAEYIFPGAGLRWQKNCVVLTNRECFSACNTFIRNMKACPRVTVLGDRTGGGGGMPFSSELPNGWLVRFSACPQYDVDMQIIEHGIDPDVFCALDEADVAKGTDTLVEAARELLKKN